MFVKDGKYVNRFCQSCGMPMPTDDLLGTNEDGSANQDYCHYCYQKGAFTQDCTMEEMIAHCAQFVVEFNKDSHTQFSKEEAVKQMQSYFPHLKRWAK
ncbi:MAG: zinc ribbon domain-containing protein [Bacteroidales bacterium]|nr:zinc ribbon domain-containing protein [Bacteroidales bacterium]